MTPNLHLQVRLQSLPRVHQARAFIALCFRIRTIAALCFCLLCIAASPAQGITYRALLIGIDHYNNPKDKPGPLAASTNRREIATVGVSRKRIIADLKGAANDVQGLRDVLIARFAFKPENIKVVPEAEATRQNILEYIDTYLIKPAAEGDVSLFFFAGHGSQIYNSRSSERDGLDETIVPVDALRGAPDVRDKELAKLWNRAIDHHIRITAIFDSCYSASISRGSGLRSAMPASTQIAEPDDPGPKPESRGALILAAAGEEQIAEELEDTRSHIWNGVFTRALLESLRLAAPGESAGRIFFRLRTFLWADTLIQNPVLSANEERRRSSLFGDAETANRGKAQIGVIKTLANGQVELHGGYSLGLDTGTELVRSAAPAAPMDEAEQKRLAAPLRLRIVGRPSISLSRAAVIGGDRRLLRNGDLFEVALYVRKTVPSLRLHLDAAAPADASLVAELRRALRSGLAAEEVPSERAHYLLSTRAVGGTVEYAWVRAQVVRPEENPLPERTRWIPAGANAIKQLLALVQGLERVHAWLTLRSPEEDGEFPYQLALHPISQTRMLESSDTLSPDVCYGLSLRPIGTAAKQAVSAAARALGPPPPRYVYVFNLDSEGRSSLLVPEPDVGNRDNSIPNPKRNPAPSDVIPLPQNFQIGGAMGLETFITISTRVPITDPGILEFDGVKTRGRLTRPSVLEKLFFDFARGQARGDEPLPSDWTIDRTFFRSGVTRGGVQSPCKS